MRTRWIVGMLVLCVATGGASAAEIWHGWMNLSPCSSVEWRNEGPLGLPSPTVRSGPQELHGWLSLNVPTEAQLFDMAKECAGRGVAAATIAAVLTNWGAAQPAFAAEWNKCLSEKGQSIASNLVSLRTESRCVW